MADTAGTVLLCARHSVSGMSFDAINCFIKASIICSDAEHQQTHAGSDFAMHALDRHAVTVSIMTLSKT